MGRSYVEENESDVAFSVVRDRCKGRSLRIVHPEVLVLEPVGLRCSLVTIF